MPTDSVMCYLLSFGDVSNLHPNFSLFFFPCLNRELRLIFHEFFMITFISAYKQTKHN